MSKKSHSWAFIALMLFLFFPVGIWFLCSKISAEKEEDLGKAGKWLQIFGWAIFGIGCFYLLACLAGDAGSDARQALPVILILFHGCGLFCVILGDKYSRTDAKQERYAAIIRTGGETSIDKIAAAYPTDYETACKDLQQMLKKGYFHNAYIDLNQRELVLAPSPAHQAVQSIQTAVVHSIRTAVVPPEQKRDPKVIKCPNCGAANTVVPGTVSACEYCTSPLA